MIEKSVVFPDMPSKLLAVNYRPVSLTCITCKLFEYILTHLEDHNFFNDLQHGYRSGRSCETQLVTTTFQELAEMHIKGSQIDIAVSTPQKLLTRYLMMVSLVNSSTTV